MRLLSIDYLVTKTTFMTHNMLELFLRNKCLLWALPWHDVISTPVEWNWSNWKFPVPPLGVKCLPPSRGRCLLMYTWRIVNRYSSSKQLMNTRIYCDFKHQHLCKPSILFLSENEFFILLLFLLFSFRKLTVKRLPRSIS